MTNMIPKYDRRAVSLAESMKVELLRMRGDGAIPDSVVSFNTLHKYVDANTLGDAEAVYESIAKDEVGIHAACRVFNDAIEIIDTWLKNGGSR